MKIRLMTTLHNWLYLKKQLAVHATVVKIAIQLV